MQRAGSCNEQRGGIGMYKTQGRVENFEWEGKLGRERERQGWC